MRNATTCLFFLFGLALAAGLSAQTPNRPVPPGVPPYTFVRYDTSDHGYYLGTPFRINAPPSGDKMLPLVILDPDGYLFWYRLIRTSNLADFKYDPLRQRYSYINYQKPDELWYTLLDSQLQPLDSFSTLQGIAPDAHDVQQTSAQTLLLPGTLDSIMDLSAYVFDGVPGAKQTRVKGFVIQEIDEASRQLVFQWNSIEHLHPSLAYGAYGYSAANFDYCHGNSIDQDAQGDLLVSFRHLNAVVKIRRADGSVAWQLGGKASSFTFANDAGFSGQHDARWLPNGHIAVFDNANTAPEPKVSRAVEYQLDTLNWVATKVWEYLPQPGFYSPAMGSHQTTPERLHLINYGLVYRPSPSVQLTDDQGALLSEWVLGNFDMTYRSFLYDIPTASLQRPLIQCAWQNGQLTLSAPPGHLRYAWSTGDTTASLVVPAAGVYQVWVDQGAGMLGSQPFVVEDLSTACPVSATEAPEPPADVWVRGYFDLLGRPVSAPEAGQVVVVAYSNGVGKLVVWRE